MKTRIAEKDWADRLIELELENDKLRNLVQEQEISKLKLDHLVEVGSIGIIMANSDFVITHCNKRFYEIFDISENQKLIGEDICTAFNIASKQFYNDDKYLIRLKSILYNIKPVSKNKLELKDQRILEFDYSPVVIEGKLNFLSITLRDITATYNKAHNQNFNRVWQKAIESSNEGVWDWNLKTNKVYYSAQWKTMLGYSSGEITGSLEEWKSRVHPDDLNETLNKVEKHLKGETKFYQSEHRLRCKDNSYIWILDRGQVVSYTADGEPLRMVGTHTDITDRKKMELRLKRTNAFLEQGRKLFMLGNVIIFKAKNKEGWPIDFITPNVKRLLGYSESDIYNPDFNYRQLIHKNDVNIRFGKSMVLNEATYADEIKSEPYRLIKKNGECIWVHEHLQVLRNGNKKIVGFIGYLVDVSDMIQTRLELLKQEKQLKQLNETKDKFLSIIAHDLKGSFNSLIGFSDIILDNLENNEFENLERFAQIIHNTSNRTYLLFTNLLNWVKTQSKKIKPSPQSLSTSDIIEETIEISRHLAREKNITVVSNISEDVLIKADKNMLLTVLRNLLSNSIKYVEKGGMVQLGAVPKEQNIEFFVKDNGVGISCENLKKLFTGQENISTLGTNYEKGTGLGLIICKEFVKHHNGKIWAESKENVGTTFKFTVPSV